MLRSRQHVEMNGFFIVKCGLKTASLVNRAITDRAPTRAQTRFHPAWFGVPAAIILFPGRLTKQKCYTRATFVPFLDYASAVDAQPKPRQTAPRQSRRGGLQKELIYDF